MWMMGYNEVGGELNMADSCTGRKLRPLVPRPNNTCNRLNGSDFISLNHHLASVTDQTKREFDTQPVVVSSRWNPTPEQLRTLEELYRRGTRTPTADQIQQITAQLRRYGKIEGKNVFYWFQNHKARERQKRRRQLESCPDNDQHGRDIDIFERKESGANRTAYEVDQTKIWPPPTNCSILSEEAGPMQRAAKAAVAAESCRAASDHGWMQFDDRELVLQHHQHRRSFMEKNATWQMMQLSCPPPPTHHHHLINATNNNITNTTSTCTSTNITTSMAATTTPTATVLSPSQKLIKGSRDQYFNIFIAPYIENGLISDEDGCESQTLQLFPLRSCGGGDGNYGINEKDTNAAMNANFTTPYQFFEFLPMKN